MALYGVRSQKELGVGDFSDLNAIVDWAREDLKVDFIGLNPLHALFNWRPFNSSPNLHPAESIVIIYISTFPEFPILRNRKKPNPS